MPKIDLNDFSGGLNLRDSIELIGKKETPDAVNMTLTARGAITVRNGCTQAVTLPAGDAKVLYYSPLFNVWFLQVGSTLYVRPGDLSGSWTSHITLTTSNPVALVDFKNATTERVLITQMGASPGSWQTDGATPAQNLSMSGTTFTVFKNRAWNINTTTPVAVARSSLFFSALGDGSSWTTATDLVTVREKDMEPLTALAVAGGSLLVFKKRSAYRVVDAATGAYTTIDWTNGCMGPQALVSLNGVVYTWGVDGIYAWDGFGRGVRVSDKILPRFLSNTASEAALEKVTGGVLDDRIVFAYPFNANANNRIIEMLASQAAKSDELPASAWIMEHTLAQTGEDEIVSFANKGSALYAAMTDGDVMYSMFDGTPGADDGTNFISNYKTPTFGLGRISRLQRLRVYGGAAAAGTNTKELRTYKDWSPSVANTFDITANMETADGAEVADIQSLGHAEAFQLEFRSSGGTGAAELNRILLDLTPLVR